MEVGRHADCIIRSEEIRLRSSQRQKVQIEDNTCKNHNWEEGKEDIPVVGRSPEHYKSKDTAAEGALRHKARVIKLQRN